MIKIKIQDPSKLEKWKTSGISYKKSLAVQGFCYIARKKKKSLLQQLETMEVEYEVCEKSRKSIAKQGGNLGKQSGFSGRVIRSTNSF